MAKVVALWDELRAQPGPFHLALRGQSMWPAAPEGSLLAVTPCPTSALRPGDMVTFRMGVRVLTHRVRRVLPTGHVVSWGDSLLEADPPIPPEDVLGRAETVRRGPLFVGRPRLRLTVRRLLASLARRRDRSS